MIKKSRPYTFKVGDKVLLEDMARKNKLYSLYLGPFEVKQIHNHVNTTILRGKKLEKVHNNRLKPYYVND